jgi:hypothetical protein
MFDLNILQSKFLSSYDAGFALVTRQEADGESCDRRARCKKNKIRNPSDPTKCIKCPPLMRSDPTKTVCVRDNDVSEEDKRNTYEEKIKEKIKEKLEKFKEKIAERLEKKKEEKNKEWEEKDKQRQGERNQKKFRRMAVCLPLVAAAIGTQAMLEMADGGFSEDLLDSINGDMLEVWPSTDIDDSWLDNALPDDQSDITEQDYAKEFLVVGDAAAENAKRSIEKRDNSSDINTTSQIKSPSANKRNIFTAIANAFKSIIRVIIAAARSRAGGGGAAARATRYFSEGRQPNLKRPGESQWTRAQQLDKAKEVAQNKNWKRCLRGEKAEK